MTTQPKLSTSQDYAYDPLAHALDALWCDIVLEKYPGRDEWEFPSQAYGDLIAEYRELKAFYDAAMEHLTTTTFAMVKSAAAEKQTN